MRSEAREPAHAACIDEASPLAYLHRVEVLPLGSAPLSDALRRALAGVCLRGGTEPSCTLQRDLVLEVERTLGTAIPYGVLATCCATRTSIDTLVDLTEEIPAFYAASEVRGWRAATRFRHVALDAWGDWPRFYACWARCAARSDESVHVFDLKKGCFFDELLDAPTLEAYARLRFELEARELETSARFELTLSAPRPKSARRVRHPRFGLGTVVGTIGADKLEIEFEDGVRTLLARFVVDEPST